MNIGIRILLLLLVVPSTYFFIWVHVSLFLPGNQDWTVGLVALACAIGAGWFIWSGSATGSEYPLARMLYGAILLGGIGFTAGYFGPLIFTPSANQGLLLGLFITGPLGFLLGAIGGLLWWPPRGSGKDGDGNSSDQS